MLSSRSSCHPLSELARLQAVGRTAHLCPLPVAKLNARTPCIRAIHLVCLGPNKYTAYTTLPQPQWFNNEEAAAEWRGHPPAHSAELLAWSPSAFFFLHLFWLAPSTAPPSPRKLYRGLQEIGTKSNSSTYTGWILKYIYFIINNKYRP